MTQQNSRYSSTRYHDYTAQEHFSFEDVVLKGLASDGGLFHPETVPNVRSTYLEWKDLSFSDLAFQVMRLYIDPEEISDRELKSIVYASYSTFRHPLTVPLITLDRSKNLHLLELFHGPTFAFKDVALQFLGNLFEFFLVRKNAHLESGHARHHLTVIGATSGDTGSAAIYGLRGKKDVSIFIMFPDGKVSPIQAAQMTTVLDANVHNIAVQGTFDDCQDMVKALFGDAEMNKTHHLAAVNSINWARILAQITYYFCAYFQLLKQEPGMKKQVNFVIPTGNFGSILAGYYAKRMGLPIAKLVIATNENDILHRFWQTGTYSKHDAHSKKAHGGFKGDGAQAHEAHVKETLSPAMDILVSSNFERLFWHLRLQYEFDENPERRIEVSVRMAGAKIQEWFQHLKSHGFFTVEPEMLELAKEIFGTYRVSDEETLDAIRQCYRGEVIEKKNYVLDPHSAIGVAASLREIKAHAQDGTHTISLATAHPAKFSAAVEMALKDEREFNFDSVLPEQFVGLERKERKFLKVAKSQGLAEIRRIIIEEVEKEIGGK
jgi:threonine synthase